MEKQKKSYGKTALIILLLIVTIASLVLATYAWAKYSTMTSGDATAQVAKWDVDVNITEDTNKMEETYQHVLAKRMAPGTSGSFEITIDPKNTEVDFHYEIVLDKLVVVTQDDSGTYKEEKDKPVPAHLHFYTDVNHQSDNEIYIIDPETGKPKDTNHNDQTQNAKTYLQGDVDVIKEGGQKNDSVEKVKKVIYWEWPYENPNSESRQVNSETDKKSVETGEDGVAKLSSEGNPNGVSDYDDQDTADGINAYTVQVQFKVTTTQSNPVE